MSAAIGGTAAAIGGGKFTHGAITGAFVVLFNHASHQARMPDDPPENAANQGDVQDPNKEINKVAESYIKHNDLQRVDLYLNYTVNSNGKLLNDRFHART